MPCPTGLGGSTFLSLIAIYMFTKAYRTLDLSRYFSTKKALLLLPVCAIPILLGFSGSSLLPAFIVTAVFFEVFRRISLPWWMAKVVLFVSPSCFAIYLLHMTSAGLRYMNRFESWLCDEKSVPVVLSYFIVACVTYIACLGLDVVRRLVLHACGKFIKIDLLASNAKHRTFNLNCI